MIHNGRAAPRQVCLTVTQQEGVTMKLRHIFLPVVTTLVLCIAIGIAQSPQSDDALHDYASTPVSISWIDWHLVQLNLDRHTHSDCHDAWREGRGGYFKEDSVVFDHETMTFKMTVWVLPHKPDDKRSFDFLSTSIKKGVCQGVVELLMDRLEAHFPRVESLDRHVEISFRPWMKTDALVAIYKGGRLQLQID
jgi:hypothetical protein